MAKILCKIEFSAYGPERYVAVICGTGKRIVRYCPETGESCASQIEVLRRMDIKDDIRVIDDFSALAKIVWGRYSFEKEWRNG